MPGEKSPEPTPDGAARLFARGIWHGERLFEPGSKKLTLPGIPAGPIRLDLSCMRMGQTEGTPSWTARMIALRDSPALGLFRLAWLETFLRAADAEGSKS
jgi:CRISPR-associated endonuclease/helicase Cas3